MRVSQEVMDRHHAEIIEAASRMLRARGIQGLSVVDLMQAVGLTHGGFYRHFASKDVLVAEATAATFKVIAAAFDEHMEKSGAAATLADYVAHYLSPEHVASPELGCPIPAYGGDIARESALVRAAFAAGYEPMLDRIGRGLACPPQKRRARATELISLMSGAIIAARAAGNDALTRSILAASRKRATELIRAVA